MPLILCSSLSAGVANMRLPLAMRTIALEFVTSTPKSTFVLEIVNSVLEIVNPVETSAEERYNLLVSGKSTTAASKI